MNIQKLFFSNIFQKSAKFIFLICIYLISTIEGYSQQTLPYTDISKIFFADSLSTKVEVSLSEKNIPFIEQFHLLHFIKYPKLNFRISPKNVTKNNILKFNIYNSDSNTHGVFLYPGSYVEDINLYLLKNDKLTALPKILAKVADSISYHHISLNGKDSATIVAEIKFLKTYTNNIKPMLVDENYLQPFINTVHDKFEALNIFTLLMCGLMSMMLIFSIANYIQGFDNDFLLYSGYVIFSALLLFSKAFYGMESSRINYFLESYLDFIFQAIGFIFYMLFMVRFLSASKKYPFIHKLYHISIYIVVFAIIIYSAFHFLSDYYVIENQIENLTKLFLLAINLIFIVYCFNKLKDHLLRFIFWGNLLLFLFSIGSFILIVANFNFPNLPILFKYSLFYYEIGLFFELSFFLMGLSYKNRRRIIEQTREKEFLKIENHRIEFEQQLAVYKAQQSERHRISLDMHDELGSGMTAIRLYSEIAKNRLKENTPSELIKISNSANNLLSNLNAIIWSMNSSNDTIDNFISYIRAYAIDYFEGTALNCKFISPEEIPAITISGDTRRNLFLCIKETLNNSLKYSEGNEIKIEISINHQLRISISDNGKGIDLEHLRTFGNGIKNIKYRMEHIDGRFDISNQNGTVTILEFPFK